MKENILKILQSVKEGKVSVTEALKYLETLPFEDLGFAKVDHHRSLRQNYPEVIFCQGKTPEQIEGIMISLGKKSCNILATRANKDIFQIISQSFPNAEYYQSSRLIVVNRKIVKKNKGTIMVISAGTADFPVAEEAVITAEIMGNNVKRLYDVGVAGIHRLLAYVNEIREANVIIVVAGMEGALASVVGGLVSRPVVAVPTSVGYGANFNGLSALLSMLNSCSPGIGVVNIDNGFGGGRLAAIINEDQ
ncbi:MAG: nickel pincer cofactor biosynthesis protein LarB [Eubacteriales bacterium]